MTWRHLLLRLVVIAQGWLWVLMVVVPWILAADRLPDPVASNWGFGGGPDGSLPLLVMFAFLFATAAVPAAVATALLGRNDLAGPSRGTGVGVVAGIGAFAACLSSMILWANLDAPRWSDADHIGLVAVVGVLGAPLLVAWAVRSIEGALDDAQQRDGTLAPVSQGPSWQGTVAVTWPWAAIVAPVLVGWLITLAVSVPVALISAGFSALLVGVGLAFTSARVTVDEHAVTVALGPFGWPTVSVPTDEIEAARVEDLRPMGWGGWGYRGSLRLFGRAAVVLRAGEALVLDLSRGRRWAVTIDDAQGAASALARDEPAGEAELTPEDRPAIPEGAGRASA